MGALALEDRQGIEHVPIAIVDRDGDRTGRGQPVLASGCDEVGQRDDVRPTGGASQLRGE